MLADHYLLDDGPAGGTPSARCNRYARIGPELPLDGLASLRDLFDAAFCPMEYRLGTNRYPWGVLGFEHIGLPGIDVFRDSGLGSRKVARTRRHILANPGSDFVVSIPLATYVSISQMGVTSQCGPGSFVIFSTERPYSATVAAMRPGEPFTQLLGKISGALMRQLVPELDECPPQPISLATGTGSLMKGLFELLLNEREQLPANHAMKIADLLIHVIADAAREVAQAQLPARPSSSMARVREIAKDYILRNLAHPDLDTKMVAVHCGVSERYLHAAFASTSMRVGAYIREARLRQCREALCNPALRQRSIEEIASSWGFLEPGSFSRTYKARYGISPRAQRKAALDHPGSLLAAA